MSYRGDPPCVRAAAVMLRRLRLPSLAVLLLALAAVAIVVPAGSAQQDTGQLEREIEQREAREAQLGSQAERLGRLERKIDRQVALLQARLTEAQIELNGAQTRLARTQGQVKAERARALRLRKRLAQARKALADHLEAQYKAARPDLVSVVLNAKGFEDLLERSEFLRRAQDAGTEVVDVMRDARADAKAEVRRLARLERRREEEAVAVQRRRDAIASIASAVARRREAVAQARAARLALKRSSARARTRAARTLKKLQAEQAKARVSSAGPGGPWAIPWAIVQCESGGQNLPPNAGARASGYYQFIPSTWKGLGGSTPHAYLAPKAEQDRLAAKLWAGGAGARNWDCAAIVGIL